MLDFSRALAEAVPPAPDVDEKLAAFLESLLSQRVARRDFAIREALRAVGVEEGSAAYPVNFGPAARAKRATAPSVAKSLAPVGPALTNSSDALPAYDGGDPHAPAAGASSRDVDAGDLPEGMRPKGASTLKIVAAVAAVILLALIAWAVTSASGPDEPQPIRRAF
jgi:hypothetical protein